MDMQERLMALYSSGHVKRFHAVDLLKECTVGAHVYGAQLVAAEVCRALHVDDASVGRIMLALLYHDAPEVYTGDIPANTKRESPVIDAALESLEQQWFAKYQIELPDLSKFELSVVRIADGVDLMFTLIRERSLGNRQMVISEIYARMKGWLTNELSALPPAEYGLAQQLRVVLYVLDEEWSNAS